jgi:excisionase family DNA binding protein
MTIMRKTPIKRPVSRQVSVSVSTDGKLERHLRMSEAASVLGVSRSTLYRLLSKIRHRRIPAGGLTREIILIPESALEAFLAQHDQIPEAEAAR